MSDQLPVRPDHKFGDHRTDLRVPKIGEWYWVTCEEWVEPTSWVNGKAVEGKSKKNVEVLMCVHHLASNHVQFRVHDSDSRCYDIEQIRYRELHAKTRLEPGWREIIQQRMLVKQAELAEAIKQMTDKVQSAGLLPDQPVAGEAPTLLPAVARRDPKECQKELEKLKDKTFPAAQEQVKQIMQELTALQGDMCLPLLAEGERMAKAVEGTKDRIFVLQLYAGLCEEVKLIKDGAVADINEPITIRQMLRYMDEETLIDYDKGGMDYKNLGDFDKWIAKDRNLHRMAPETRCVVAFKIRRNRKNYGPCSSIEEAWVQMKMHKANQSTYLILRNGAQVWRLWCEDLDFDPRLLPLRDEFNQAFMRNGWWDSDRGDYTKTEVTPDDFDYDQHVDKRKATLFAYNRVLFLLQGILDRSKTFSPHPPINLGDPAHIDKHLRLMFDEEIGLPSWNPPVWEEYRDKLNQTIKRGSYVWCGEGDEVREGFNRWGHWSRPKYGDWAARRPRVCKVRKVSRDRKTVTLTWELSEQTKTRWEVDRSRPVKNKPGWYYQKPVEENLGMKRGRQKVPIETCFAVEAYTRGDYKKFLCDAHLKGAYLEWAPQLLGAEKWWMQRETETQKPK